MKEPVRRTQHPWMAGISVALIAGLYFYLLAKSDHPDPGQNLNYNLSSYAKLDQVETRYEETGSIDAGVEDPTALAIGADGSVYVGGKDAVAVYTADGVERARFKVKGTPISMAAAPGGKLLLGVREAMADAAPSKSYIQVLDETGAVTATWDDLGGKALLTSIAVSGEDVFVADMGNRVVHRYNLDGVLQNQIGKKNTEKDVLGIVAPSPYFDLAVNDEGTLWIVNPGRLGLESYRYNGDLITSWYNPSMKLDGFSGCCNPSHIAFLGDGKLITLEKGLVRVKKYDVTSGEFEELVAGSDLFPKAHPIKDLAVDAQDRILLLDPRRSTVRIFEQKEKNDERTSQPA